MKKAGKTTPPTAIANERLVLFSGALTVSAGVNVFDAPRHVNAALLPGLLTVILLSGRLQIKLDGQGEHQISGPAALVIENFDGELAREQVFAPDIPIRYVLVKMDKAIAGQQLVQAFNRVSRDHGSPSKDAILLHCPASRLLQSMATQIMTCPMRGAERELYLGGKALQLSALAVAHCIAGKSGRATPRLSSREVAVVYKARDILIGALQSPPGLEDLARQVGLNVQKLNRGFRHVFGSTVYGFLQEYRLEQAYKLLSGSEMSVSEVAYHVGYGAAHFATVFRERFGISPSQLR